MTRRKNTVYSRFNVAFMNEKRKLRDEAAKAHKLLAKQRAKLARIIGKVRCSQSGSHKLNNLYLHTLIHP